IAVPAPQHGDGKRGLSVRSSYPTRPPVSHAGPGQSELERGTEITLSAKFRLDVESLVNELESKGEALWTGERGPAAIAEYCGPSSIRKLAARDDDKLNDEIVNTIPIIAIPADSRIYLLPSYAFEHIRKGRFDRLSSWVKSFPSANCRWVFGVCQQNH
ncbi:hypothetical protein LTR33_018935, partial [Friedmanniomyces endolithicus]